MAAPLPMKSGGSRSSRWSPEAAIVDAISSAVVLPLTRRRQLCGAAADPGRIEADSAASTARGTPEGGGEVGQRQPLGETQGTAGTAGRAETAGRTRAIAVVTLRVGTVAFRSAGLDLPPTLNHRAVVAQQQSVGTGRPAGTLAAASRRADRRQASDQGRHQRGGRAANAS